MIIFEVSNELNAYLSEIRGDGQSVAFVPTMGALHEGHLQLIDAAKSAADIVVCSIFVNPTQFNDAKDLERYPRPIEKDVALLESRACDILFLPSVEEMYPPDDHPWRIDLGTLDEIWEGKHRPGHFQGVSQIVFKLFALVRPDIAVFGQKDFQQVMVIRRMVQLMKLPIELLVVPTLREKSGLAMSSRNMRLSDKGKEKAAVVYQVFLEIKKNIRTSDFGQLERNARDIINGIRGMEIEYLAICDATTLEPADNFDVDQEFVAIAALWLEGVRLIDNMLLYP